MRLSKRRQLRKARRALNTERARERQRRAAQLEREERDWQSATATALRQWQKRT
jgi:hypothetical protein